MSHKNKKNRPIIARLLIVISLLALMIPLAPIANADIGCWALAQDKKDWDEKDKKLVQGYIITILEEEIAASTSTGETIIALTCARRTFCEVKTEEIEKDGKKTEKEKEKGTTTRKVTTCTDTYVELSACDPSQEGVFCQKVQAILATSGVQLLMTYLALIYRWAAGIVGLVSVVYLVIGGFMITASQDNSEAIDKAKEKIMQSIGGLILLFLSAVILYTINPNFFNL